MLSRIRALKARGEERRGEERREEERREGPTVTVRCEYVSQSHTAQSTWYHQVR
jgi:hypothetical protein